jgi:NitT/TauT family transport system substrate-binding protein
VQLFTVFRHSRRTFAASLAAALLVWAVGACAEPVGAQQPVTIKVGTIGGDVGGEVFYAKELGLFKKVGLDVDISTTRNGAAISAAVASGALDVGYSNVVSIAIAHDRGLPFLIIGGANMHETTMPTAGILAVARTSGVHTAKDLNGKTVATIGLSNISYVAVRAWIDRNGGDSSTVHFVEVPFSQMEDALKAGRVDAASIDAQSDPNLGKPGDPLRQIGNVYDGIAGRFLPSVWFSTSDWIKAHPDEARKVAMVLREAATWANSHHRESAQMLLKYTKNTLDQIESVTRVTYVAVVTPDLIQPVIDDSAKYELLRSAYPAKDIISPLAR